MKDYDGRHIRSQRTRARILNACAALIREGNSTPASIAIAKRAGVVERTVFNHYGNLHNLYLEAHAAFEDLLKDFLRRSTPAMLTAAIDSMAKSNHDVT